MTAVQIICPGRVGRGEPALNLGITSMVYMLAEIKIFLDLIFFSKCKKYFFFLPSFQDDILYMPIVILTMPLVKEIRLRDSTVAYPRPLTSNYC